MGTNELFTKAGRQIAASYFTDKPSALSLIYMINFIVTMTTGKMIGTLILKETLEKVIKKNCDKVAFGFPICE